jgi:hypothetical protein
VEFQNGRATEQSDPTFVTTWKRDAKSRKDWHMTTPEARKAAPTLDLSATKAAGWLSATAFLALLVLYFVGMDQGATSVFGSDTHVHEFLHDARHLLGFPCH